MATITPAVVKRIADLSRLHLSASELKQAAIKLSHILDHFAAIQKIDTADVKLADDVTGLNNVGRLDTSQPEVLATHEALIKAAPATAQGQIKVKAIFE